MSQPQDSEPAFVSTPDELVDAIVDDRRHIVVTAHLDLTYLPLRQNSICVDGCASPIPEIRATQSIRGNCPDPPTARDVAVLPQTPDAVALLPFQAGQCLIVTYEDMFPVLSPDFWMDSLYLRMAYLKIAPRLRPRQYTTLLGLQPPQRALRGSARRFITRTTFQGDGGSPTVGVWADDSTYIENCTFANLGGNGEEENSGDLCARCSAAVNAAQAHVTVAACTFLDPVPLPGATYIRAWHNSRVLDSGCVFAPTPRLQLAPFKLEAGARIYSDNSQLRIRSDPGNLLIGPLPTSAAAQTSPGITRWGLSGVAGDFLQRDDPWFIQIQSDLNATVLPEPAYVVGPNAVPLFDLESAAADAALPSDGSAAGGGGVPSGLIGIIAGIALLLCIALVLGCVLWRGKRQTKSHSDKAAAGSASRDMKVSTSGSDAGLALGHSTSHGQKLQRAGSSVAASARPPSAGPSSAPVDGAAAVEHACGAQRKKSNLWCNSRGVSGSTAAHAQGVHPVPHENIPPPPAPGADTPVLLAWINSQLDRIAPQQVVMRQYKLLGPSTRRQGGVLLPHQRPDRATPTWPNQP